MISLPIALTDDPEIKLSLRGMRLLLYLCKLGEPTPLSQDEVLNGRLAEGKRLDIGSKLTSPRDAIGARRELVALGWLQCEKHQNRMVYKLTLPTSPNGN